ncbi:hypothetical protein N3930_15300 [Bacillus thuringiensis]|nr:hypothetical protein [Bacillus thuringiensis]
MQDRKKAIKSTGSVMKPDFAETDAQKVKQEIQNDVRLTYDLQTKRIMFLKEKRKKLK